MKKLVVLCAFFLFCAVAIILRGYWYPGVTGSEKASILLNDNFYPGRALIGINYVADGTFEAFEEKSRDFEDISPVGRAMLLRMVVCSTGEKFTTFSKRLSIHRRAEIKQIGRVPLLHRGAGNDLSSSSNPSWSNFEIKPVGLPFGEMREKNALDILAGKFYLRDAEWSSATSSLVNTSDSTSETIEAIILMSGGKLTTPNYQLLEDLILSPTSRYRVAGFWAFNFLDTKRAQLTAKQFISSLSAGDGRRISMELEMKRAGSEVKFSSPYKEYLCK